MKFQDFVYVRPDVEATLVELGKIIDTMEQAVSAEDQIAAFHASEELMKEFSVTVEGLCFVLALENGPKPLVEGQRSLMVLTEKEDSIAVRPADWVR